MLIVKCGTNIVIPARSLEYKSIFRLPLSHSSQTDTTYPKILSCSQKSDG